jgi:centlein
LLNVTEGTCESKADLLHELNVNSRIKYLEEELSNAQADKEFVWSLWRQLQSSNPDLTNAIGSVVQREKEKYDVKERQAIDCLKAKNEEIERLKYSILTQQNEIGGLNEKLKKNDLKYVDTEKELDYLRMNAKTYEDKEHMYEQILRGKDDKYEKAICDFNSEKEHLFGKIKDLVNEMAKQQENDSQLKIECEQQRQTIEMLNKQIKSANKNYENLMNELNDFRSSVDDNLKLENEKLKATVLSKAEKNEELRNELDELWNKFNLNIDYIDQQDKIIKQLKVIQNELHKTIKSQQVTFENENKELKNMYDQITKKYEESLSSEKHVKSETLIVQQQNQQNQYLQMQKARLNEKANIDLINAQKFEISQLKLEMDLQLQRFNAKKQECDELNRKLDVFVGGKCGFKVNYSMIF